MFEDDEAPGSASGEASPHRERTARDLAVLSGPEADPLAMLDRALGQADVVIAGVRRQQASLPTPCDSWDVRALINHLVDEMRRFVDVTTTGRRGSSDGDIIGDDWISAYRAAASSLAAAWSQPGALERPHRYPGGDIPAETAVGQQVSELVIHSWDIAKATGQVAVLDPELGLFALDWARTYDDPQFRGQEAYGFQMGPQKVVAVGASVYDQLAAFAGRSTN
ncbi:TIGR03086 family metal-binding protein [Dactylosporangium sp. NPDC049525]|uniref:TIGR03086 family metal-binding protein n=1 Tax=Dactylosporangium sp. NPDC049525 TaxID=3154730 RepID=UPI00341962BC